MSGAEISEHRVSEIRALLTHEERDQQVQGVRLARALGDWSAVVEGCEIGEDHRVHVPFGELNGAILELVLTAPTLDPTSVTRLDISGCSSLYHLDMLSGLTELTELDVSGEYDAVMRVMDLDGLANNTRLTALKLNYCTSLVSVHGLAGCTGLKTLSLVGLKALDNVDGLEGLTGLTELDLESCTNLTRIDALAGCTELTILFLSFCKALESVEALTGCTALRELRMSRCRTLRDLSPLANLTALEVLWIEGTCLEDADMFVNMKDLTFLSVRGCTLLRNVDGLAGCTRLATLYFYHQPFLTDISSLEDLPLLDHDVLLQGLADCPCDRCAAGRSESP